MPEITVTETQRERLSAIQSDIEAAYIDTYGHIRTTDVVQYLLDTYTPPEQQGGDVAYERIATAEFQALQAVAGDVEGVPGSGIDTETMRGELVSALGVEEFASRLATVDDAGDADAAAAESDAEPVENGAPTDADAVSDTEDESPADADAERDTEDAEDGGSEDDETSDSDGSPGEESASETASPDEGDGDTEGDASDEAASGSTPGGDGPGAILSAANQLLDDHDDKWRDGGSDEPYEVDLPDGTTEKVRTKDDIRGLLFKHY